MVHAYVTNTCICTWQRYVGHVVSATDRSDLDQVLSRRRPIARDEVHQWVWCLLDVPHLARLSHLWRGRPRPCSRRLPAAGALFVFLVKISNCIFVRIDTNNSDIFFPL